MEDGFLLRFRRWGIVFFGGGGDQEVGGASLELREWGDKMRILGTRRGRGRRRHGGQDVVGMGMEYLSGSDGRAGNLLHAPVEMDHSDYV